jgi:hypothetical protein
LSSSDSVHSVTIDTDPDARVEIFDGYDRLIQRGWGSTKTWDLAPGLYTVRAELAGQQLQSTISVPDEKTCKLKPQIYSPVPIEGAATTHEYYEGPAWDWSLKPTVHRRGFDGTGRLFIFLRLSSLTSPREGDIAAGLSLHDAEGKLLLVFGDKDVCVRDDSFGWVLVSTSIAPGFYRLCHQGQQLRETCLYVYPNLSTQIFITYFDRPRLEQMRVFLHAVTEQFQPSDPTARAVELALAGLQNGIGTMSETLPRNDQRDLLGGKFRNPMLGLIGAHWLLEDPTAQDDYVQLVLRNLRGLLGHSPDVLALQVAAAKRFRTISMPTEKVVTPPMIRRGLEILVRERPQLIPEGGLFESILPEMYLDSPWTCWRTTALAEPAGYQAVAYEDIKDKQLDWMESAVLSAGTRGEFDDQKTEPIARHFVVTPGVVRQAFKRLTLKLEDKTPTVHFNKTYLMDGQETAARLQIQNWAVRGAAVYNQPLPAVWFPHERGMILTNRDIQLRGPQGGVRFRTARNESQLIIGSWLQLLQDFGSRFSGLIGTLPKPETEGSVFGLITEYDRDTRRGAIVLDSVGPSSKPGARTYGLLTEGAAWRGLSDSFQMAASEFGLPRQLAEASGNAHQTILVANVEGSFQFRFETEVRFRFWLPPQSLEEDWNPTEPSNPLSASGFLTASGAFQISFTRSKDDIFTLSIHRAARSESAAICLAWFHVATSDWLGWLERSHDDMETSDHPIAIALLEMAQAFRHMVKDRAYFYASQHKTDPDESWYRAEEIATQEIGASIARVLEQKYASQLRSQIQQDVSGRPLLEIQVGGAQQMDILKQALDGKFDLGDRRNKVNLRGVVVSLVDAVQRHDVIFASSTPKLMTNEGDRLVAYDSPKQSSAMAMAKIDARVATTSGPAELSAPSATLAIDFINASPGLIAAAYAQLVEHWLPEEKNGWSLLMENIGSQAGGEWNAILQLRLHWAIDLRETGGYFELEPEAMFPSIRRELRLLIPFYSFTYAADFANLEQALPLYLYQAVPKDVSSAKDLQLNDKFYSNVYEILSTLKPAVERAGFSTSMYEWNVPQWMEGTSSAFFQSFLAWESGLCDVIFEGLSRSRTGPRARPEALDTMARKMVEALAAIPGLVNNPQATNAVRTVIFTTALSLLASSLTNVFAEMSVTAVDPKEPLSREWIASPESMPLEVILGHGRISATSESSTPLARRALVAAGR